MPTTVPNQRIVQIHKSSPATPFLQISIDDFCNAYKDLNATACCLFLYLLGNQNGYQLSFSPKAVENQLGMPVSTVSDQWKKLVEKGYLVQRKEGSNIFDFYDKPKNKATNSSVAIENAPSEQNIESETNKTKLESGTTKFVF